MKDLLLYLLILASLPLQNVLAQASKKQLDDLLVKLIDVEIKYAQRISLGMAPSEVKAKLGSPTATSPGFPDVDGRFVYSLPFSGQLNYTTWTYVKGSQSISWREKLEKHTSAFIDSQMVSDEIWDAYMRRDSVIFEVDYGFAVNVLYESGSFPELRVAEHTYEAVNVGDTVSVTNLGNDLFMLEKHRKGVVGVVISKKPVMTIGGVVDPSDLATKNVVSKHKRDCRMVPYSHSSSWIKRGDSYQVLVCVIFDRGTQTVGGTKVFYLVHHVE